MPNMIDQIRASKLPSNMMQFAARGALQVSAAENLEILVHLAVHNKIFGDLARMTLAGWDEKSCLASAADPKTPAEVLAYLISPDNLRPKLLPALLENPSVPENLIAKLAVSALREPIEAMFKSSRVRSMPGVIEALKSNPYLKKEEAAELRAIGAAKPAVTLHVATSTQMAATPEALPVTESEAKTELAQTAPATSEPAISEPEVESEPGGATDTEVSTYLKEHAEEIKAEGEKPFQAIGGIVDILGADYFPVTQEGDVPEPAAPAAAASAPIANAPGPAVAPKKKGPPEGQRQNTVQKINSLDVKGRIQLALKGNKEERSILIRDGTKVVALAVLEAPKLSDGEVEKFASQKNVLESVLRQIPLKRRFMKNYIVVRNLVANPRTPLDLGLGLMKNLLVQDLKNLSANKEVSETIRKLALKNYKQKMDDAKKK
jgi:hypothetical protein